MQGQPHTTHLPNCYFVAITHTDPKTNERVRIVPSSSKSVTLPVPQFFSFFPARPKPGDPKTAPSPKTKTSAVPRSFPFLFFPGGGPVSQRWSLLQKVDAQQTGSSKVPAVASGDLHRPTFLPAYHWGRVHLRPATFGVCHPHLPCCSAAAPRGVVQEIPCIPSILIAFALLHPPAFKTLPIPSPSFLPRLPRFFHV